MQSFPGERIAPWSNIAQNRTPSLSFELANLPSGRRLQIGTSPSTCGHPSTMACGRGSEQTSIVVGIPGHKMAIDWYNNNNLKPFETIKMGIKI
jgi:hypothetical protein